MVRGLGRGEKEVMDGLPTKILLATDGSEDAAAATRGAVGLSIRTGSRLHPVHAWRPLPRYSYPGFVPEGYSWPYEREARDSHLKMGRPVEVVLRLGGEIDAGFFEKPLDVKSEVNVRVGGAAAVLEDQVVEGREGPGPYLLARQGSGG
jgi:nucleotide-binding universal stress UspA family protein